MSLDPMRLAAVRIGRSLLLLAGLAAAGWLFRQSGLGVGVRAAASAGPLAFLALGAGLCAAGLPRQIVAYAAGLAFGVFGGTALALAAEVAGAALSYLWARALGRRWAAGFLDRRQGGRIVRLRARLLRQPFTATLTLRLLPVGNSLLLSLLAGVAGLPAAPFLLASALGFIPQTVVFVLLGHGIEVDGTVQVALGLGLFAASAALGLALMRRVSHGAHAPDVG